MPRYYFHLYDDIVVEDEDGLELPDADAGYLTALRNIRSMLAEQVMDGRLNLSHRIEIEDAEGRAVKTVAFRDAVTILG